jgi:hypothetical protein
MNGLQIFAFVVMPIVVMIIGGTAGWLHLHLLKVSERREREQQLKG